MMATCKGLNSFIVVFFISAWSRVCGVGQQQESEHDIRLPNQFICCAVSTGRPELKSTRWEAAADTVPDMPCKA
ncbi:hypothetical protein V8F06_011132 [Rhypophila decipiens]